ncbi:MULTISPECIES: CpaD family pilus assembly protein [Microvirga]|uniref:CpaD family pilus assembly protein n=1 Tax=Microvirga TaxID=186650 RepID=UPI0021C8A663|nr:MULTISPECIES: CpaD family pilus assembly protein [unclassified Microvirga]
MFKKLTAAACFSLLAAGCADRELPAYALPYAPDVRDRHPIVLKNELTDLDIYPTQISGLDLRQKVDLRDFARSYLPAGKTNLIVSSPYKAQAADNAAVDRFASVVVKELVSAGVPRAAIEMKKYQSFNEDRIEPVKVAFVQVAAGVPHPCGDWPEDLGAGSPVVDMENLTSANFGCAHQQNLAAQMANPMDAVRPARETSPDSTQRVLMLRRYVAGEATPSKQTSGGFQDSDTSSSGSN